MGHFNGLGDFGGGTKALVYLVLSSGDFCLNLTLVSSMKRTKSYHKNTPLYDETLSISPTITTPSSGIPTVRDRLRFLTWATREVLSSALPCSCDGSGCITGGGGARISGTGPEKSLPVMRSNVFMSEIDKLKVGLLSF